MILTAQQLSDIQILIERLVKAELEWAKADRARNVARWSMEEHLKRMGETQ